MLFVFKTKRHGLNHSLNQVMTENANPEYTMVGEANSNFIMDVFTDSKAANKPWQIFAAA